MVLVIHGNAAFVVPDLHWETHIFGIELNEIVEPMNPNLDCLLLSRGEKD